MKPLSRPIHVVEARKLPDPVESQQEPHKEAEDPKEWSAIEVFEDEGGRTE